MLEDDGENRILVKGGKGKKAPQKLKATICCDNGFMGEAEISYAGPNALARAKLAGEVISERIQILGLQGQLKLKLLVLVQFIFPWMNHHLMNYRTMVIIELEHQQFTQKISSTTNG